MEDEAHRRVNCGTVHLQSTPWMLTHVFDGAEQLRTTGGNDRSF